MNLSPKTVDELRAIAAGGDDRDRAMARALLAAAGEGGDSP